MADRRRNLGIPSGVVFPFAGTSAPYGYLICDGRPVLQSEYPNLFLSIGFSHGDGSQNSNGTASGFTSATHFNLPDYRGRFLRGVDGLAGVDPDKASRTAPRAGGNTGNTVGSVQADSNKLHGHSARYSADTDGDNNGGLVIGNQITVGNEPAYTGTPGNTRGQQIGGDGGNESRPKNVNVNYIIKI